MIGWFANAIMRGWDDHANRHPAGIPDSRIPNGERLREIPTGVGGGFGYVLEESAKMGPSR